MAPGGYKNTWKEESNLKRTKMASGDALDVIEKASAEGMSFKSSNKAIKYLQAQGGPSRSWWLNPSNKKYLQLMKNRIVTK